MLIDVLSLHDIISPLEWEDKTSNFQYLNTCSVGESVEESQRGEETGMRTVIDGVNGSQRMIGDKSRGMCMSVAGVGVSVMK